MNKEQAKEILKTIRHNSTMQTDYTIDDIDQALDIAIDSLEEDKFVLLQCTDGRIFIVDSKKSIDDLESESCKKCKRIDEQEEIRKEHLLKFEKPYMPSITVDELNEQTNKQIREMGKENIQKAMRKLRESWEPYVMGERKE